jgi:hypothetical protein
MSVQAQVDGIGTLEFPDGTDPAVVQSTVKRMIAQKNPPAEPGATFGHTLAGEAELGGAGIANIIPGGLNALNDILNQIYRTPGAKDNPFPTVPVGKAGQDLVKNVRGFLPGTPNGLDISDEELRQADPTGKVPIEQLRSQYAAEASKSTPQLMEEGGTPAGTVMGHLTKIEEDLPAALPVLGAGSIVKNTIRSAAENAAGEATAPIADIDAALRASGYRNLPRQGEGSTAAKIGAKITGEQPLAQQNTLVNQAVDNVWAKHEAGVPQESDLTTDATKAARDAGPGKVYNAAHDALPEQLTQDPELAGAIKGVGDTSSQLPRSPDVDGLKETMLNQPNMTRDELFANIAEARKRAAKFMLSDGPNDHAIGEAYQGIADAYENFVGRQLAKNTASPVSLEDWQNARTAFAKNYTVEAAIKGKDVQGSKLAALQLKNPNLLTGGLRLIAEQHNRYPLSSGFGPSTFAPEGIGASGTLPGITARHVAGPLIGGAVGTLFGNPIAGGAAGLVSSEALQSVLRRVLGGTPGAAEEIAGRAVTDPRFGDFFDQLQGKEPEPPFDLRPPPGKAFTPHQPDLATGSPSRSFFGTGADNIPPAGPMGAPPTAAGHPGQIPLFELLSHGVEQAPEEGLTAGPMGSPRGEGIPFERNAAHEAGGLETHEPTLMELLEDLRDHPDVMSQGVPEDIMSRTPQPLVNRGGSDLGSVRAASPEAMNRGTRNVLQIDPDGRATPVLKDVTQIDAKAPKGHLLMDEDTGEILDRGGMSIGNAEGLRNRYRAMHSRPSPTLMDLLEASGGSG